MTMTSHAPRHPAPAAPRFRILGSAALLGLLGLAACDASEKPKAAAAKTKAEPAKDKAEPAEAEPAKAEAEPEPAAEAKPAPSGPKLPDDGCKLLAKEFVDLGKYTKAAHTLEPTTMDAGSMLPGTLAGVGCQVKRTDNEWAVLSAYYFPTDGDDALKRVESKIKSFPEVKLMGLGKAAALMAQPNADKLYASGDIHIVDDDHVLVISWRPSDEPPLSRAFMLGLGTAVTKAAEAATQ